MIFLFFNYLQIKFAEYSGEIKGIIPALWNVMAPLHISLPHYMQ